MTRATRCDVPPALILSVRLFESDRFFADHVADHAAPAHDPRLRERRKS
jgi:hypothetical protein